jgi:hypothetical protein
MADSQTDETFTVHLTGSGVDIKREVSVARLAIVLGVVMGAEPLDETKRERHTDPASSKHTKLSLREFLDEAKAATKPDQIVTIGQYISIHEGNDKSPVSGRT